MLLSLCMAVPAQAMTAPVYRDTATPVVLPYLLSGEAVVLDGVSLNFDLKKDKLTQTLLIHNPFEERQEAEIAVPIYTGLNDFDDYVEIKLDGKNADKTFRFAEAWAEEETKRPDYVKIASVSIIDELEKLKTDQPYELMYFDEHAPLNGYSYEISSGSEGSVSLILTYNPAVTKLLIDPYGEIDSGEITAYSGQTSSTKDGEAQIDFYMSEGQKRTCRVLVIGNSDVRYKLLYWPDSTASKASEDDSVSSASDATVRVSALSDVTPLEFYEAYIHKYDDENSDDYNGYVDELAHRYIDRQLQSGGSYVDCSSLSYMPRGERYLLAAVIKLEIAPKVTRRLEISSGVDGGFAVADDTETQELYYPLFAESLESFGGNAIVEITVKPRVRGDDVEVYPEMDKAADKPIIFTLNANDANNLVIISNTKYDSSRGSLLMLMFFSWPHALLALVLILAAISLISYYRKRRKRDYK